MLHARFFLALERLMHAHGEALDAGVGPLPLEFLLRGPGREYLETAFLGEVALVDVIRFLDSGCDSVIEEMKVRRRLPEALAGQDPLAPALARAIADKAAELAGEQA